jgi:hypothetical protein
MCPHSQDLETGQALEESAAHSRQLICVQVSVKAFVCQWLLTYQQRSLSLNLQLQQTGQPREDLAAQIRQKIAAETPCESILSSACRLCTKLQKAL